MKPIILVFTHLPRKAGMYPQVDVVPSGTQEPQRKKCLNWKTREEQEFTRWGGETSFPAEHRKAEMQEIQEGLNER